MKIKTKSRAKMYDPKKKHSFVMMFGFDYPEKVAPRNKSHE
tara:strand:- start:9658 stop:9780 length:123 start_codon:yes stop_codon:yes gene_type:complete